MMTRLIKFTILMQISCLCFCVYGAGSGENGYADGDSHTFSDLAGTFGHADPDKNTFSNTYGDAGDYT